MTYALKTPGGHLIPFEAFNLFYRDARAATLAGLRREQEQLFPLQWLS
jgi:hypothetical protein